MEEDGGDQNDAVCCWDIHDDKEFNMEYDQCPVSAGDSFSPDHDSECCPMVGTCGHSFQRQMLMGMFEANGKRKTLKCFLKCSTKSIRRHGGVLAAQTVIKPIDAFRPGSNGDGLIPNHSFCEALLGLQSLKTELKDANGDEMKRILTTNKNNPPTFALCGFCDKPFSTTGAKTEQLSTHDEGGAPIVGACGHTMCVNCAHEHFTELARHKSKNFKLFSCRECYLPKAFNIEQLYENISFRDSLRVLKALLRGDIVPDPDGEDKFVPNTPELRDKAAVGGSVKVKPEPASAWALKVMLHIKREDTDEETGRTEGKEQPLAVKIETQDGAVVIVDDDDEEENESSPKKTPSTARQGVKAEGIKVIKGEEKASPSASHGVVRVKNEQALEEREQAVQPEPTAAADVPDKLEGSRGHLSEQVGEEARVDESDTPRAPVREEVANNNSPPARHATDLVPFANHEPEGEEFVIPAPPFLPLDSLECIVPEQQLIMELKEKWTNNQLYFLCLDEYQKRIKWLVWDANGIHWVLEDSHIKESLLSAEEYESMKLISTSANFEGLRMTEFGEYIAVTSTGVKRALSEAYVQMTFVDEFLNEIKGKQPNLSFAIEPWSRVCPPVDEAPFKPYYFSLEHAMSFPFNNQGQQCKLVAAFASALHAKGLKNEAHADEPTQSGAMKCEFVEHETGVKSEPGATQDEAASEDRRKEAKWLRNKAGVLHQQASKLRINNKQIAHLNEHIAELMPGYYLQRSSKEYGTDNWKEAIRNSTITIVRPVLSNRQLTCFLIFYDGCLFEPTFPNAIHIGETGHDTSSCLDMKSSIDYCCGGLGDFVGIKESWTLMKLTSSVPEKPWEHGQELVAPLNNSNAMNQLSSSLVGLAFINGKWVGHTPGGDKHELPKAFVEECFAKQFLDDVKATTNGGGPLTITPWHRVFPSPPRAPSRPYQFSTKHATYRHYNPKSGQCKLVFCIASALYAESWRPLNDEMTDLQSEFIRRRFDADKVLADPEMKGENGKRMKKKQREAKAGRLRAEAEKYAEQARTRQERLTNFMNGFQSWFQKATMIATNESQVQNLTNSFQSWRKRGAITATDATQVQDPIGLLEREPTYTLQPSPVKYPIDRLPRDRVVIVKPKLANRQLTTFLTFYDGCFFDPTFPNALNTTSHNLDLCCGGQGEFQGIEESWELVGPKQRNAAMERRAGQGYDRGNEALGQGHRRQEGRSHHYRAYGADQNRGENQWNRHYERYGNGAFRQDSWNGHGRAQNHRQCQYPRGPHGGREHEYHRGHQGQGRHHHQSGGYRTNHNKRSNRGGSDRPGKNRRRH